jgi:hypothetical protein
VRDLLPSPRLARAPLVAALLCASACVAAPDDIGAQQGAVLDICATAPEGALCDDNNVCTVFDVCKSGVCKGSAAPNGTLCTDGNVCTANDSCRAGVCKGDPVPDTTACTDGDPCTVGDVCKASVCVPGTGTLTCNDGIACTFDLCVAGVGCVFSPVGDCSMPKDAGPEAPAPDGSPGNDGRGDGMMSGGDVAGDRPVMSDGPPATDTASEDAPVDMASTDTSPPDASPIDASPIDAAPEVGGDAPGADAADALGAADGGADADAADASSTDAASDAAADAVAPTLPVLRASGGACTCAVGETPRPGWTLVALGLVGLCARRRPPRGARAASQRRA